MVSQPAFLYYEGTRYLETVPPDQLEDLYPFDSMLECGVITGAGSDAPLVDPNPMVSIGVAVTRRSQQGRSLPRNGVPLMQALRMHTLEAARANFEEQIKGSLTPGKLADFVVLDTDPFSVSQEDIQQIRTVMTVLGGSVVWTDPDIHILETEIFK